MSSKEKETITRRKKTLTAAQQRRILKQRAEELAQSGDLQDKQENIVEVVEFEISYVKYAIESKWVNEVYPMLDFTFLPCTPDYVMGILNLRGTILSLIDIRRFFGLSVHGLSNMNRVLVVECGDMEVGILADFILGVRNLHKDEIQPPISTIKGVKADFLKGVTPEPLIIIDIEKVLEDPKLIVNEEVEI